MSPKAVIRIGRGAACDVRFDPQVDTRVSAYHAEIRFSKGHYVIADVGSSNGTLLNGKVVREHRLRSGDKLRFGGQGGPEVRFDIDDVPCKQPERWVKRTMLLRYVPLFWVMTVVSSGSW